MTDFLSRLVDRVLGDAPVAKPLIAPHFAQGAEIFGPDAATFAVTQTESYRYGDEQQPAKAQSTQARSAPTEPQPQQQPPGTEARDLSAGIEPLQSEIEGEREISQGEISQLVQKPGEVIPANEMRKDMPLSEREPSSVRDTSDSARLEARSTERQKIPTTDPGSYSDTEENLASSPLSDRATENPSPSLTRREGEPKQPPETEALDLSEREPSPVRSAKVSTRLEQQKSLTLRPDSVALQIERPSSAQPSDMRATKQRTSNQYGDNQDVKSADAKKPHAQQAASLSVEGVVPVSAVAVEYDSGASRIVRPERITPRVRADSPSRTTTANTRPDIQTAPTIKVTIGRIEVRAILPPAPRAQETALPAPKMSLDDYLKSVSGERR